MYPFPWYGTAVWNCVKMFVDKNTQEKLLFVSKSSDSDMPEEITQCIDESVIPECVGGKYSGPLLDVKATFR
jgi:hypothetical protein